MPPVLANCLTHILVRYNTRFICYNFSFTIRTILSTLLRVVLFYPFMPGGVFNKKRHYNIFLNLNMPARKDLSFNLPLHLRHPAYK
jgi:hypothetical protein